MNTSLTVFGINHQTAPLAVREKCSFTHEQIQKEMERVAALPFIDGCVILVTCNRTEYYVASSLLPDTFPRHMLYPDAHIFGNSLNGHIDRKDNYRALHHLFRVAAGLDSQVLGENEVLYQVKEAYRVSQQAGCLGKNLHKYFERSFRVGKKVRRETAISKGAVSVASLAIKVLEKQCGLQDRTVMLIGVNKITMQVAHYLLERAIRTAFVGNRTYEKAVALARTLGGEAVHLNRLEQLMREVDVVITATSAPHFIIKKDKVWNALDQRTRPLFIMDLAVPRDVDPDLSLHPMVVLHNLEDINPVVNNNMMRKQAEARLAEQMVTQEAVRFAAGFFKEECHAAAEQEREGYE